VFTLDLTKRIFTIHYNTRETCNIHEQKHKPNTSVRSRRILSHFIIMLVN